MYNSIISKKPIDNTLFFAAFVCDESQQISSMSVFG